MPSHVVAATADFPPGTRRLIDVDGRAIVVFNVGGDYFALLNKCPHNGGSLAAGTVPGLLQSTDPDNNTYSREGEIIRCPWHGWEVDIKTGKTNSSDNKTRARAFPVHIEPGQT